VVRVDNRRYGLLRMHGRSREAATDALATLREETSKGVGDWRLALAEEVLQGAGLASTE